MFETATLNPSLIEAAVRRREPENPSENWITDARRRLAKRRGKKPETKSGQIWALWPEIKAALADGQRIKSVRMWLEEEAGVMVTTDSLRSYLRRCRERDATESRNRGRRIYETAAAENARGYPPPRAQGLPRTPSETVSQQDGADDPMAVARSALSKHRFDIRKSHGDGDPSDRNLI